jgi:hypothetical protein
MSQTNLRNSVEWALMVTLVLGLGAIAQAQDDASEPEGRIIQIGPADADDAQPAPPADQRRAPRTWPRQGGQPTEGFGEPAVQEPAGHWIGVMAGPLSPALRAHLDVPEDQGILAYEVVPDSPADKAGLKKYDVLLRANDVDLHDKNDLVDLVRTAGDQQQQITLEVLRGTQRETVWVTPAERPERPVMHGPAFGEQGAPDGGVPAAPNDFFGWFGDRFGDETRGPNTFRRFGPGAVVGGRNFGHAEIPNGVSVSIQKQNDEPAQITVQRGDETWEIVGDDPESLEQLPDDLRPFVEQLLGQTALNRFQLTMPAVPARPGAPVTPGAPAIPGFDEHQARIRQQLEAMEQRMRELEQRLQGRAAAPADDTQ